MTEVGFNVERLKVLCQVIEHAKNDSERFAALLAVSKMVCAAELTEEQRKDIFIAVGFSFPLRLISSQVDDECPKDVLNNLGLVLLSTFVRNSDLAQSPENKKVVPVLIKLLKDNYNEIITLDNNCLSDCFEYFTLISTNDFGCQLIFQNDGLKYLICTFCTSPFDSSSLFWNLLHRLIRFNADLVWNDNQDSMLNLLEHVTEKSLCDFSDMKFFAFENLSLLILSLPESYADTYFEHKWVSRLNQSLFEIFQSKISAKQRNPSIILCHRLTEVFGLKWLLKNDQLNQKELTAFSLLLFKLICVEMQMIIYNWTNQGDSLINICDSSEMSVYLSCCALFEAACTNIANLDVENYSIEVFSVDNVKDFEKSSAGVIETIANDLIPLSIDVPELETFVVSCLRTVGCWFNIQVFALTDLGLDLIAKLFPVFKSCLQVDRVSVIKSFTPAFLNYAESSRARSFALEADIFSCLLSLIVDPTFESVESKTLCSQCLMTFCIESEQFEVINDILPLIMNYSLEPSLSLVLQFYICTLSLMLWNKSKNSSIEYPQSKRFFRKLVSLLHGVHSSSGHQLKISKKFATVWDEIEQLWCIIMKELIRSARENDTVGQLILKSEFPSKVRGLVSCKSNDVEVAESYNLFNAFLETLSDVK